MNDKIMVKTTSSGDWVIFKTVTRAWKSSSLYVRRGEISNLASDGQVIAWDGSFAVFTHDREADTVLIRFYWLNMSGDGHFTGREQDVILPRKPFMDFITWSACYEQPNEWKALSVESRFSPRLVFLSRRNLHDALADKLTRRKLCKFLRDNFHWRSSTEIIFTDDYIPRSFFFREKRKDTDGICGGLILHGQEDMKKAYYEIHT